MRIFDFPTLVLICATVPYLWPRAPPTQPTLRAQCHGTLSAAPLLVGTHHKSGTVLLTHVLKDACRALGWSCAFNDRPVKCASPEQARAAGLQLCLLQHGIRFKGLTGEQGAYRFVHAIRDPMEVVLSGYSYHLNTTEKWAHRTQSRWNGTTYVKFLNSLSLRDGLLAEVQHTRRDSLKTMPRLLNRTAAHPCTMTVRFEDFARRWDYTLAQLFNQMGVSDFATLAALNARVARHNIYRRAARRNSHVSRASAATRQRMRALLRESPQAYAEIQRVRRRIGYPAVGAEGRSNNGAAAGGHDYGLMPSLRQHARQPSGPDRRRKRANSTLTANSTGW